MFLTPTIILEQNNFCNSIIQHPTVKTPLDKWGRAKSVVFCFVGFVFIKSVLACDVLGLRDLSLDPRCPICDLYS